MQNCPLITKQAFSRAVDQNTAWPPQSPVLTLLNFFIWSWQTSGHILCGEVFLKISHNS